MLCINGSGIYFLNRYINKKWMRKFLYTGLRIHIDHYFLYGFIYIINAQIM